MLMKKFCLYLLSIVSVISVLSPPVIAKEALEIRDAWIPLAPPVVKVMAGYLTIHNPTSTAIVIDKVTSTGFETVEMHETIEKDGMARMVKKNKMTVPAKSDVIFKRGGLHLMLINPKQSLKKGEKVTLSFSTNTGVVSVSAEVKEAAIEDHSHHHHNH